VIEINKDTDGNDELDDRKETGPGGELGFK
jgi:hypothetical protein